MNPSTSFASCIRLFCLGGTSGFRFKQEKLRRHRHSGEAEVMMKMDTSVP